MPKVHSGVCQGSLGELYQGPWPRAGVPEIAIVSLPTDRFSWVHYIECGGPQPTLAETGRTKSDRAARIFLDHYGVELPPGRWEVFSELAVGKGMASSTADIVATLRCLYGVFGIGYDEAFVMRALSAIERADSVFLDEFALYLSGRHEIVHRFGDRAGWDTCYAVGQGLVDTDSVGDVLLAHYGRRAERYRDCLDDLVRAFATDDLALLARCSTRSAELSQEVLPQPSFDDVHKNLEPFHADGMFVAHTGRVIGYLFRERPGRAHLDELSAFFREGGLQCSFAKGGF